MSAEEKERRAHPRKLVSTGVAFHDADGAPLRGWLHDISRGGCFIATPSLFTFGEELGIDLTLPFPRVRVNGKARVVWVREQNDRDLPAGMGVAFVDVGEEALAAIDKIAASAKLSRPKTMIGIAPPPATSSPSYSPDVQPALPEPEPELVPVPEPVEEPIAAPVVAKNNAMRDRLLIGGAALVSVLGLVALAFVFTRHHPPPAVVDAAVTVDAPDVTVVADVADVGVVEVAEASVAAPIVDASADVAVDAHVRDAGADGGKKKPKPRIKRR